MLHPGLMGVAGAQPLGPYGMSLPAVLEMEEANGTGQLPHPDCRLHFYYKIKREVRFSFFF